MPYQRGGVVINSTIFKKLVTKILPQTGFIQLLEYFGIVTVIVFLRIVCSMGFQRIAPKTYSIITEADNINSLCNA